MTRDDDDDDNDDSTLRIVAKQRKPFYTWHPASCLEQPRSGVMFGLHLANQSRFYRWRLYHVVMVLQANCFGGGAVIYSGYSKQQCQFVYRGERDRARDS